MTQQMMTIRFRTKHDQVRSLSTSYDTQREALLDLYIEWEAFLNRRINALPGSLARRELDVIYFKALPTIVELTEVINDSEIERLVKLASTLLEQREADLPVARDDR